MLPLVLGKQVDHSIKTWRNRLFQLGSHQNAGYCQVQHIRIYKYIKANNCNVMVKNAGSDEQAYGFVELLLVKRENFLDSVLTITVFEASFGTW